MYIDIEFEFTPFIRAIQMLCLAELVYNGIPFSRGMPVYLYLVGIPVHIIIYMYSTCIHLMFPSTISHVAIYPPNVPLHY